MCAAVTCAREFADTAFGDQSCGDQPYAAHPDAVAPLRASFGELAKVVGYLHDVVEDTAVPLDAERREFGDRTAGDTAYTAGRFLTVEPAPKADATFTPDFNKAYNPPCAVSELTTCPTAPPQHVLPVRVAAGEKYGKKRPRAPGRHVFPVGVSPSAA